MKRRVLLTQLPIFAFAAVGSACAIPGRGATQAQSIPVGWPLEQQQLLREFDQVIATVRARYIEPDKVGPAWQAKAAETRTKFAANTPREKYIEYVFDALSPLEDPELGIGQGSIFGGGPTSFMGIGISAEAPSRGRGRVLVMGVYDGSPAQNAGLRAGDSIVAIDGSPIREDESNVFERLRGQPGSTSRLTVRSPGQPTRTVSVGRAQITSGVATESRFIAGTSVGWIRPSRSVTGDGMPVEIVNALRKLNTERTLNGLILDLRTMGSLDFPMPDVLELFAFGNVAARYERGSSTGAARWAPVPEDRLLKLNGRNVGGSQTVPLAILVSEFTLGPAETLAGLLQALSGRAWVIGTPTRGLTANINETRLSTSGLTLRVPVSEWRSLSGDSWRGTGVKPNPAGSTSFEDTLQDADVYIEEAVRRLRGR
jgi:C-terminal processing protease CtpA/Prc